MTVIYKRYSLDPIAKGSGKKSELIVANKRNLGMANLRGVRLDGCDMSDAYLCYAEIDLSSLQKTNLSNSNFCGASISMVNLSGANLRNSSMIETDLFGSNLRYVDLSGVKLCSSNLGNADFRGACLDGANLSGVDIRGAFGNGREIISFSNCIWKITRTKYMMAIACEQHPISSWWRFSDEEINVMDPKALDWWKEWKPEIMKWIKEYPAIGSY